MSGPLLPFGGKLPAGHFVSPPVLPTASGLNAMNLPELQRAQMMEFSQRLRAFGLPYNAATHPQLHSRLLQVDPLFYLYGRQDPRLGFFHEEPKPSHSYIGLISMGILSSKDKKLVLSDIYQYIQDNYAYFRTRGPGWRNSIRHNLSLNDCFIKSGRAANGKGHYWAIHPAVEADFEKGDFRRRRAQRKVRKAMGLTVADDEDESPSPPPPCSSDIVEWRARMAAETSPTKCATSPASSDEPSHAKSSPITSPMSLQMPKLETSGMKIKDEPPVHSFTFPGNEPMPFRSFPAFPLTAGLSPIQWQNLQHSPLFPMPRLGLLPGHFPTSTLSNDIVSPATPKKRAFDVDSLLAPDTKQVRREERECGAGGADWEQCASLPDKDESSDFQNHVDSDIEVDDSES